MRGSRFTRSPEQKQRLRFFAAHIPRLLPTTVRLRMRNEDESDGD
jgi:hypothetical protein